ncbi:hypothetical protein Agub_g11552, partial [Astrephomene gubernaculifera]
MPNPIADSQQLLPTRLLNALRGYSPLNLDNQPRQVQTHNGVDHDLETSASHQPRRHPGAPSPAASSLRAPSKGMGPQPELAHQHGDRYRHVPWFAYPLLVAAVVAVSSAATVFSLMPEVPALTLAAWRLQLTAVLLGLAAAQQWRDMSAEDRSRTLHSSGWLAASGACLAVHFGSWVWGLQHTSLPHSLLLVSATPL